MDPQCVKRFHLVIKVIAVSISLTNAAGLRRFTNEPYRNDIISSIDNYGKAVVFAFKLTVIGMRNE